jgi:uncharacterized ubiquitin-like protein YukD
MLLLHLHYKGSATSVEVDGQAPAQCVIEASHAALGLPPTEWRLKILSKGKILRVEDSVASHGLADGAKLMVMASSVAAVESGQQARSDPTVRGFASEDSQAARRAAEAASGSDEASPWGTFQHPEHKFCRFDPCTWQSLGTRPSSRTPHAFEARRLLLKLATDPAVVHIMAQRKYRVGTLAEMDPIDDHLAEKMEGGGSRLLGYNTNGGLSIHVRLRTTDLTGFEPYSALLDTLLHELVHNEVGPHNDHFWHLFGQLKADYLYHHAGLAARGLLFNGKSGIQLAGISDQVADVRAAVLSSIAKDRMAPLPPQQQALMEGYLAVSAAAAPGGFGGARASAGGAPTVGGALAPAGTVGGAPASAAGTAPVEGDADGLSEGPASTAPSAADRALVAEKAEARRREQARKQEPH